MREDKKLAYFHFDREDEARTMHHLDICTAGTEERECCAPREWWWNGSREAPTLRASLKSRREILPRNPETGVFDVGVVHGHLTDGHWTPCDDDTLTRAF